MTVISGCSRTITQLNQFSNCNEINNSFLIPIVDTINGETGSISLQTLNDCVFTGETETFLTGSTLSGNTLILTRNDGYNIYQDLSEIGINYYLTGGTYSNGNIYYSGNGTNFIVDVSPLTADTYTNNLIYNFSTYDLILYQTNGINHTVNLAGLASDVFVISGIYNPFNGEVIYTNSSGGTFTVSGFVSGLTDTNTYLTGSTLSGNTLILTRNDGYNIYQDLSEIGINYYLTGSTLSGNTLILTLNNGDNVYQDLLNIDYNTFSACTGIWSNHLYACDNIITIHNSIQSINSYVYSGESAFAFGFQVSATTIGAHAEGGQTIASGGASHAEGYLTTASGDGSHAEGSQTIASGGASHAEGGQTIASGGASHAEGYLTTASGDGSHAEGGQTIASGGASHAEGGQTIASGDTSHAEGGQTIASGSVSHAEGYLTTASGDYSHAEGEQTTASGDGSHAEGYLTTASGSVSHAEGYLTTASGDYSHAEGEQTTASGRFSHAENDSTIASGDASHAEGFHTIASGDYSHAGGYAYPYYVLANGAGSFNHSFVNNLNISGVTGDYSAILGGINHSVLTNYSGIFGGEINYISGGTTNVIVGGKENSIIGHNYSAILGGSGNIIDAIVSGNSFETIVGGENNVINDSHYSTILGGSNNQMSQITSGNIITSDNVLINGQFSAFLGVYNSNDIIISPFQHCNFNNINSSQKINVGTYSRLSVDICDGIIISATTTTPPGNVDVSLSNVISSELINVNEVNLMHCQSIYLTDVSNINIQNSSNVVISGNSTNITIFDSQHVYIPDGYTNIMLFNFDNNTTKPELQDDTAYFKNIVIHESYTPISSSDPYGVKGQITWDDNYAYIKTNIGWAYIKLNYDF